MTNNARTMLALTLAAVAMATAALTTALATADTISGTGFSADVIAEKEGLGDFSVAEYPSLHEIRQPWRASR